MKHDPLRPTFERLVPGRTPDGFVDDLLEALESGTGPPHRRAGRHFMLWLPTERRRTWSPWLHLDVLDPTDPGGPTRLWGRFTPAPSLWTGVMLTYLALATVAFGGGRYLVVVALCDAGCEHTGELQFGVVERIVEDPAAEIQRGLRLFEPVVDTGTAFACRRRFALAV